MKIPNNAERIISVESNAGESRQSFEGVSISSSSAVQRWWGREILVHDEAAINMERAGAAGLPFLVNHDTDRLIGRINNVRLDGDKLRGDLAFDAEDPEASRWKNKLESGIARDFSIRYSIDEFKEVRESGVEEILITRWTPIEASCVSCPADVSVGIGRNIDANKEDRAMTDDRNAGDAGPDGVDVVKYREAVAYGESQGEKKTVVRERARQASIDEMFAHPRYAGDAFSALRRTLIQSGATVEQSARQLLEEINRGDPGPMAPAKPSDERQYVQAQPGADSMDKWMEGVDEALTYRFKLDTSAEAKRAIADNPFSGLRLLEIGRDYLRQIGVAAGGLGASEAALMSLQRSGVISHATSDFTSVLANIATKALTLGYSKAPETWRPFCRVVSLPDYKQAKMVNMTAFTSLAEVAENGEYTEGTIGDVGENMQMVTYGKLFGISRQAILNDDADAFSQIPRAMGAAAARVVGNLVYNTILLGNPTLGQDSAALFVAGHGNYVAGGSGAAPSVTTLNAALTAMGIQTDPSGLETLNIRPKYLIVSKALEGTALVLTSAMAMNDSPGATSGTPVWNADNRFANIEVISDARIDASDSLKWFMAADPNEGVIDTINVAFLDGREEPYMEQQEGFTMDGVRYKVRLEATAAPIAYQGLYHNDGN